MRRCLSTAGLLLILAGILTAQSATVQNAASPLPSLEVDRLGSPGLANIVAPGMLAVLSYSAAVSVIYDPIAITRPPSPSVTVSIRPSGSNVFTRAEVISYGFGSATFVIPRNIPLGGAEIEYKVEGQPTAWTNVTVVQANFEFYRIGRNGPVIAQSTGPNGSLNPVGLTTPAQPGHIIRLTGTGLGNGTTLNVTVGGVPATIIQAQPHRARPGLDEILIQIPAAVADGCYLPLVLTYGATTVTSTISKTSIGAPCVHPFQLSTADMKTLDNGGYIAAGEIDMNTSLQIATADAVSRNESADAHVREMTAADVASYFAPSPVGCTINQYASGAIAYFASEFVTGVPASNIPPIPPDPGSMSLQNGTTTLTVDDISFSFAPFPPPAEGPLANPPAPIIAGGNWLWRSSGSSDLAASSFAFILPAPIQLSGGFPLSLLPGFSQTLRWNGAAFDSGAILSAFLSSPTALITCTAPATSGTLTIPSNLLGFSATSSLGTLTISLKERGSYIPHAQLKTKNGNTLLMFVNYSSSESLPVDIQ
jgi:uncharacterized protein (TIGR03437 family)